ncbi:triacylglycerol lipase [Bradyrhizobium neotropicale]|uniref:esterase/lipase family protein n=1 Tax=Bradyrhizobium neotropicale TaxID=1497615 RepID=UPI001AD78543|nr:alpha/beta fold hydrolase [Bradyrhizobium neotropicale]MBO4226318.1 alpha/beta fold hydrolase [Bradyrhizobium neotropicale]
MSTLGATPAGDGVVLLHGISRTARSFRKMESAIERAGYTTLNLDYASRRKPLEALAEDIHPAIETFAGRLGGRVHFVCHSMGGLLARVYLAKHRPHNLGRVMMLGTPNGGSEITDRLKNVVLYRAFMALLPPIDYPVGIIAGNRSIYPVASAFLPRPHDGRVSVANTKLDGMTDHIVVRTSHPWLVRNDAAIAQTIAFLREGKFTAHW